MSKNKYASAEAFWKVTTEGDCEGKTVRDLGVHFGFIDDIAFSLADKCEYSLCFKLVDPMLQSETKKNKVNISLDIDSGTWNMTSNERVLFVSNLLKDRNVMVKPSTYYASVEISMGKNFEAQKEIENQILKKQAISKLSKEEIEALGIIV